MKYVSTRGEAPALSFTEVVLTGLARDGGLYVPERWPSLDPATVASFAGKPYAEVAEAVIAPFAADIPRAALRRMIDEAYAVFQHPAVTPLVQIAPGHFLLELFHGPTLAFKDVAMQLLARLMDHALETRGARATIVAATSGDTGGAAVDAFRGRTNADLFVLFPAGRVSDVQRRQMTTAPDANVHALAVDGTFDDAQGLVKGMFNHHAFRDRVQLSGVNSINWGRIVAQVVYYFVAAAALGSPARKVSFTVPTGNFGDIFAAYVAKRMGLPVERLVIATNVNDILARTVRSGRYEPRGVRQTTSPSMDIQVSSNFERLLYEATGRDGAAVRRMMAGLAQSGGFDIDVRTLDAIRAEFDAGACDEPATAATMARVHNETGLVIDPHTATAVSVAEGHLDTDVPMVTLATAHPAKFPDAVFAATGVQPALPRHLGELMSRPERQSAVANDLALVERLVEERARAVRVSI